MSSLKATIRHRLDRLVETWNPSLAGHFRKYCALLHRGGLIGANSRDGDGGLPYWLLLPSWLVESFARRHSSPTAERRFLEDILWGQFCLFLFTKTHDDVFDRQTEQLSLVFAGDELLLEAYRAFLPHFAITSPFWHYVHNALRATIEAILTVDNVERNGFTYGSDVLRFYTTKRFYTRGYAVCKIATFAACLRTRRMGEFSRAAAFADELALVGQVIDDFQDMTDDLERGRLNSAASFLLRYRARQNHSKRRMAERITRIVITTDAVHALFSRLKAHLDRADRSAAQLGLRAARAHVDSFRQLLDANETRLHKERMKLMMSGLSAVNRMRKRRSKSTGQAIQEKV